jgi:hypothetical protein
MGEIESLRKLTDDRYELSLIGLRGRRKPR